MSTRALRRLKELRLREAATSETNSDEIKNGVNEGSSDETPDPPHPKLNHFDLLYEEDDERDNPDDISDNESRSESNPQSVSGSGVSVTSADKHQRKVKRKKKCKKKTNTPDEDEAVDLHDDHSDAYVPAAIEDPVTKRNSSQHPLSVDHRHLNPKNELTRIFGSRVVRTDRSRTQRSKRFKMIQPKDDWPSLSKLGLNMSVKEATDTKKYFILEHSSQYRKAQQLFLDAVESLNPQNIVEVFRVSSYHIDTLLQMSDISRMSEDMATAADFIERALYALESAFHPLFSLSYGNCRLDYRYSENRCFFLALFRHIVFLGKKGCYRTALEFTKVLYNLNPEYDPLGAFLMIDFYALMSHEYWVLSSLCQYEELKYFMRMPNFAFSVPLAMYKESLAKNISHEIADHFLQDALLMYPGMLLPLLDKCSVQPDPGVSNDQFFTSLQDDPKALQQLVHLYVGRCWACWKEAEVMTWLEVNVKAVQSLISSGDDVDRISRYQQVRRTHFVKPPLNVLRHIAMSDIPEAMANMPLEVSLTTRSHDPLPPPDSISSYTLQPRRTRIQQENSFLSAFLRSLLPSFNIAEAADERPTEGAEHPRLSIQQEAAQLMAAVRDLLRNIQPAPVPREDEDPANDEFVDEWD